MWPRSVQGHDRPHQRNGGRDLGSEPMDSFLRHVRGYYVLGVGVTGWTGEGILAVGTRRIHSHKEVWFII
jgi:hypothetical protein